MTKKIPLLTELPTPKKNSVTTTLNDEVQEQFQFQADYVLPIERAVSLKRDTKETSIT
jgi:hypothetical protein